MKIALVTGASRGLGAAIAVALGRAGWAVAVNFSRDQSGADATCSQITSGGGTAAAMSFDVTDPNDVRWGIAEVANVLGPVDLLVNNATGPQGAVSIMDQNWPLFQRHLDFFVKAPFLLLQEVLPDWRQRKSGRVINIGSTVTEDGNTCAISVLCARPRASVRAILSHRIQAAVMGWVMGWGWIVTQLTDAKARTLKPGTKPIADGAVAGLYLFPSSSAGRGKWVFRFVSPLTRKRRDMGLGTYPEVPLRDAREAALAGRGIIQKGQDPIEARRTELEVQRVKLEMPTFEAAARRVHEEISRGFRNAKHADQWLNTLEDYVFPTLGNVLVADLRASHFAAALRPIWLSKPETASRVRQRCDTVMKWCAAQEYVVASPVSVVSKLLAKQPGKRERVEHHPAIPWREIPNFVVSELRGKPATIGRQMLELLILTAVRSGEIRGMCWEEVDFTSAIWTIPASRMKAKTIHRVPLTPRCAEILQDRAKGTAATGLVFASRGGTTLSDMVLTKVLRDAKTKSDVAGRPVTAHGFRSSFRDWASESGYPRDLAERTLAHTIRSATEAAYHRTDLLEQRRAMMLAWQRHCLS